MTTTIVQQSNNDFSVVLPSQAIEAMQLQQGDELEVIATPTGLELRRVQSELQRQLTIAERVMAEDEVALRRFSKAES